MKVENDNRFHSVIEMPVTPALLSLAEIPLNQWRRIKKVEGPRQECSRLMDLGFTPGEEVIVTQASPLGDPIVIRVRGALLALRKREAAWILVT